MILSRCFIPHQLTRYRSCCGSSLLQHKGFWCWNPNLPNSGFLNLLHSGLSCTSGEVHPCANRWRYPRGQISVHCCLAWRPGVAAKRILMIWSFIDLAEQRARLLTSSLNLYLLTWVCSLFSLIKKKKLNQIPTTSDSSERICQLAQFTPCSHIYHVASVPGHEPHNWL